MVATKLYDGLYVGSLDDAFGKGTDHDPCLSEVTHILNVALELNIPERVDHAYLWLGVVDDPCPKTIDESSTQIDNDIRVILPRCLEFIDTARKNGGVVLVHCLEGVSRSICVCLAYLCLYVFKNDHPFQVLKYMKSVRPESDPWELYIEQIEEFVMSCRSRQALVSL